MTTLHATKLYVEELQEQGLIQYTEGHHKEPVAKKPSKMTDPRNIEFKTHTDHKNTHKKKS